MLYPGLVIQLSKTFGFRISFSLLLGAGLAVATGFACKETVVEPEPQIDKATFDPTRPTTDTEKGAFNLDDLAPEDPADGGAPPADAGPVDKNCLSGQFTADKLSGAKLEALRGDMPVWEGNDLVFRAKPSAIGTQFHGYSRLALFFTAGTRIPISVKLTGTFVFEALPPSFSYADIVYSTRDDQPTNPTAVSSLSGRILVQAEGGNFPMKLGTIWAASGKEQVNASQSVKPNTAAREPLAFVFDESSAAKKTTLSVQGPVGQLSGETPFDASLLQKTSRQLVFLGLVNAVATADGGTVTLRVRTPGFRVCFAP
jgi:hypothetical protein